MQGGSVLLPRPLFLSLKRLNCTCCFLASLFLWTMIAFGCSFFAAFEIPLRFQLLPNGHFHRHPPPLYSTLDKLVLPFDPISLSFFQELFPSNSPTTDDLGDLLKCLFFLACHFGRLKQTLLRY